MNPSSKLRQSVPNSEYGDFTRKQNTVWNLDENITKIINKYKRYAPHKDTQANGINKVIESKISMKEAQPLKIKVHTSSERQNNSVCENICNNKSNQNKFPPVINENTITRSDKTTHCRPVRKYYIPEIYRISMKRNSLRSIFKNLSTLRQNEVEESLMSTYIDFLKKKHLPEECKSLSCIQDNMICSKARMILMKRDLMVDHLNEKYIQHSVINKSHQHRFHGTLNSIEDLAYKQDCYPVFRSPCKKVFHVTQNRQETKLFDDDRYKNCSTQLTKDKNVMTTRPANRQTKQVVKNCGTLAYTNIFQPKKLCHNKSATTNLEKKDHQKQEGITASSVLTKENKIDTLIQAMNDFMNEINLLKITNLADKGRKKGYNKAQTPREELMDYNIRNHRNIVSYTYLPSREHKGSKIEETVVNTHQANFDKIKKKSSIQIKFKVSTRDGCTEISKSLSHQIINCKIIPDTSQTEKTTIALNTDPICLKAILQISLEAVKGFFSQGFLSYLPYLQLPKLEWSDPKPCLCDTNANVEKNTDRFFNTGSCSKKLAPVGPHKCQYCDEVFDKACSWERHEFYCARTLKALERKCAMFRVC